MSDQQQLMTFYIDGMLFGFDIEKVLLIGQDTSVIQPLPVKESGLVGMVKLQSLAVPVIDFAKRLNIRSATEDKNALLTQFATVQQGYKDWFSETARLLESQAGLTKQKIKENDPLFSWHSNINHQVSELGVILQELEQVKIGIQSLLQSIEQQSDNSDWDAAQAALTEQQGELLNEIEHIFKRAEEQMDNSVKQVIIYLTHDGKTPRAALLIDQINDVLTYDKSGYQSSESSAMSVVESLKQYLSGLYVAPALPECFYFDIDMITDYS